MSTAYYDTELRRAAAAPFPVRIARRVAGFVTSSGQRRRLRTLLDKEPRILDDIGVEREEVVWALSLPYDVNAGQALHHVARRRRAADDPRMR